MAEVGIYASGLEEEAACDCDGNVLDAIGVCGGSCTADADEDGICDDVDDCATDDDEDGICDDVDDCVGAYDDCGVCNGPGAIYECGCSDLPSAGFGDYSWLDLSAYASTAEQSTTGEPASNAVDGDLNTFNHTACGQDGDQWWQISLGGDREVTEVSITPRQDCCHERINGARVEVDGVVCADNLTLGDDINAPILAVCPTPLVGSVVRIVRPGASYACNVLHMAEVGIYASGLEEEAACDCDGNVLDAIGVCGGSCTADADEDGICDDVDDCATDDDEDGICDDVDDCVGAYDDCGVCNDPGADHECGCSDLPSAGFGDYSWLDLSAYASTAEQSTTGEPASNAVDGDLNTFNHTACGQDGDQWWQISLGGDREVTEVSITPRQDCCHERINGARVEVDGVVCADNLTLGDDINAPILAVCPTPLVGSVVRIVRPGASYACNVLHMAEVGIYASGLEEEAACDCDGNVLDAIGVCGGSCTADADEDGICDDVDDCATDDDEDGICDDVDDCVGAYDDCGVCNGPGAIYECGCSDLPSAGFGDYSWLDLSAYASTAEQSTTGEPASNAVDGDLNTFNHTACGQDGDQWWQISLGGDREATEAGITPRQDCCHERINGARVEVDGVVCADNLTLGDDINAPILAVCPTPLVGSVVRIVRPGASYACNVLHMAEVGIYASGLEEEAACDCDGNVLDAIGVCGGSCTADADEDGICDDVDDRVGAYDDCGVCNGPGAIYECGCSDLPSAGFGDYSWLDLSAYASTAEQSTTGEPASNAVDGDLNTFNHTACGQDGDQWWQISLGGDREVTEVSITPRQDCCHERINGARVEVDGVVCADNLTLGDDINAPILAVCPTPLVGSVVRIVRPGASYACNVLHMAEVGIYASGLEEEAACDCDGNVLDAIGVCGGSCTADADEDGICDDVDDCATDDDEDGICDDVDDCVGAYDDCGICNGINACYDAIFEAGFNAGVASVECPELDEPSSCATDANNDGMVSTADLLVLLTEFGSFCE